MSKFPKTAAQHNASVGSTDGSYSFRPYESTAEMAERIAKRAIKAGKGKRVRVVMASRMGDVGITEDLKKEHGYSARVAVEDLTNFSATPGKGKR